MPQSLQHTLSQGVQHHKWLDENTLHPLGQSQLRAETPVAVVRAQHQDIVPAVAGGRARRESEAGAGAV